LHCKQVSKIDVGNLPQSGKIDVCLGSCCVRAAVPQMIADLIEGQSLGKQARRAGASQAMSVSD
jgi:hypothetical protein